MATYEPSPNAAVRPAEILRKDHESIESLFGEYDRSVGESPEDRKRIFGQIMREIEVHYDLVEEVVVPRLEGAGKDPLVADWRSLRTDGSDALRRLGDLEPDDPAFERALALLRHYARAHAEIEERRVLPALAGRLTEREADDLATLLQAGKARRNEGVREA